MGNSDPSLSDLVAMQMSVSVIQYLRLLESSSVKPINKECCHAHS